MNFRNTIHLQPLLLIAIMLLYRCDNGVETKPEDTDLDSPPGWTLVWQDEFDADSVDADKWIIADGHWSYNGEEQYYTPDEVYIHEGNLRIRSRFRSYQGLEFTSGHIESRHYQRYGRIDIKARLPGTQGLWPALWLLPASHGWPPEIDILELLGQDPHTIHMSNHWGPLPEGASPWDVGQTATQHFTGPDFTEDFHLFSLEWTADSLRWLVDETVRFVSTQGIPHQAMYLIMNTAVGGFWPGSPNANTIFPQYHDIDYVRFYTADETH